ncbi:MAG TPA: Na+/H+ antiporter NhaA [Acidimicrobiales bacterium]
MSHGVGRLRQALDHQYAAAVTVGVGALVALAWSAISSPTYQRVVASSWFRGHDVGLHAIAVNGAMTLFFAAVGLELSRESHSQLRHHLRASFPPLFGAIGGMAGTAALSLLLGQLLHSSALRRGWGVPMATDIAFTLGVLALAGPRIPSPLRIFLLTLAIADDVMSVIVLSVTGITHVRVVGLVAMVVVVVAGALIGRRLPPWLAFAVLLVASWLAFAWAGVEPALSGVVAGVLIPVASAPADRLEQNVARWSVGLALPLFALVACGVTWTSLSLAGDSGKIIVGTTVVRVVGKVIGIGAGVFLAGRLGVRRHASITAPVLAGASLLCAIGFTVPLLFAGALFGSTSATYGAFTVGLLVASFLGAVGGVALLRRATR